jgi:hypothetical protein
MKDESSKLDSSFILPPSSFLWKADAAAVALLLAAVVWLACSSGSLGSDLTHHPDEPAHFITGLMVYDYLTSALGQNPLAFATRYYDHYPKVALGHWPPVFYAFEAAGFYVLGPTKAAALGMVALCTAGVAVLFYFRCRRDYCPGPVLVLALVFLAMPLVRAQATAVMAEMFLCLLTSLAAFAFADFVTDGKTRHVVAFGGWSALALLTKGNAIALALLPVLTMLLTGQWGLLRSRRLWLTGLTVAFVSAPYYVITYRMRAQSFYGDWSVGYAAGCLAYYGKGLLEALGPGVLLLCGLGALETAFTRERPASPAGLLRKTCLAWALSVLIFQSVFPVGAEVRFLVLALPPLLLLGVRGLSLLSDGVLDALPGGRRLGLPCVGLLLLLTLPGQLPPNVHVYGAVAEAVPAPAVVLVSSSSIGEGALIVERRLRDPGLNSYTLRASKELGSSTWIGGEYRGRFGTEAELHQFLIQSAIRYIVVDEFGSRLQPEEPHQELLRRVVKAAPDAFVRRGVFPMRRGEQTYADGVYLYENVAAAGKTVELDPMFDPLLKFHRQ